MQRLTFHAGSLPHFSERLARLYLALPEEYRGTYYAKGRSSTRATALGVTDIRQQAMRPEDKQIVVVASHEDYRKCRPAKVVMVSHGVGQTYIDGKGLNHPSYSGGDDRDRIILTICAGEYDANNCLSAGQEAIAVGPFHIDKWLPSFRPANEKPVVCFSFHADIHVVPETRWAFPHYQDEITRIVTDQRDSYDFIGHCHPRMWSFFKDHWRRIGVEYVPEFTDVLDRADLYVIDTSSSAYEFASTGRPALILNAPWYRRDVHHGLRFWSAVPGLQIDEPEGLLDGIRLALNDDLQAIRDHAITTAYGNLADGHATERAVKALIALSDGWH